ncbi:MAG: phosphoribosylaminoimidazole carboxylase [Thermoplasmata archaeon HGW-Thermoplasmata-1]|nr:MAG: phosphoribosylaminoimidazole carboxylase [Thermoplasmata archaeon HGW-Thermoplasmata-1]
MTREIGSILEDYKNGKVSVGECEKLLQMEHLLEVEGLVARFDVNREARTGIPEVVLGEGKLPRHALDIVKESVGEKGHVIVTRVPAELLGLLRKTDFEVRWNEEAKAAVVHAKGYEVKRTGGRVAILTAGTSDIPVAEEARITAEELGCGVFTAYDVGVAGVHRIFPALKQMFEARVDCYVVAAGREGTLPTLVAGLVDVPVIGLPISTGYGIGGKGEAALYSMLQSCSQLTVVNVDAGFVAGACAAQIANNAAKGRKNKV